MLWDKSASFSADWLHAGSWSHHRWRPAEALPGKPAPWMTSSSKAKGLQDGVEPREAWSFGTKEAAGPAGQPPVL